MISSQETPKDSPSAQSTNSKRARSASNVPKQKHKKTLRHSMVMKTDGNLMKVMKVDGSHDAESEKSEERT